MASCSSPSPSCSSLKPFHLHSSLPFLSAERTKTSRRTSSIYVKPFHKIWDAKAVEEEKKRIMEKYPDLSDFLDKPSSKRSEKRRGGNRKDESVETEKGETESVETEKKKTGSVGSVREKPPRTTHKKLQVLGGKARRRKLLSPAGMDVRPMMEVVRASAFSILQDAGGTPASLRPGRWLDLYSGTGSVGIEAISRGCTQAHFVEMDPWVISEVLNPNLKTTGFTDVSVIHMKRVEAFLNQAEKNPDKENTFDYISVTPPYMEVDYEILMGQISRSPLVGEDCFVLVEYPLKTTMPDTCGNLITIVDRRFGRTNMLIYGPEWAQKKKKKLTNKKLRLLSSQRISASN